MQSLVHYLMQAERPVVAIAGNKSRLPLFTRRYAYLLGLWLAQEKVTLRISPCRGFCAWFMKGWKSYGGPTPDLYLAFRKQEGYTTSTYTRRESSDVAAALHEGFHKLPGVSRLLASTHVELVLGRDHCTLADCLICFTQDAAQTHEDVDGRTGVGSFALLAASHCRDAGLPLHVFQVHDSATVRETLAYLATNHNRQIAGLARTLAAKLDEPRGMPTRCPGTQETTHGRRCIQPAPHNHAPALQAARP